MTDCTAIGVDQVMDVNELSGFDMDLASTYADAWSDELVGQLGKRTRALQWRSTKWIKPSEWAEQMTAICPTYNRFSAAKVGVWLAQFSNIEVQPAREYSVCLYLKGSPETLATILKQAPEAVFADEADMEKDGTLRLWWD